MESKQQKLAEDLADSFIATLAKYHVGFERSVAVELMSDIVNGIDESEIILP